MHPKASSIDKGSLLFGKEHTSIAFFLFFLLAHAHNRRVPKKWRDRNLPVKRAPNGEIRPDRSSESRHGGNRIAALKR